MIFGHQRHCQKIVGGLYGHSVETVLRNSRLDEDLNRASQAEYKANMKTQRMESLSCFHFAVVHDRNHLVASHFARQHTILAKQVAIVEALGFGLGHVASVVVKGNLAP